MNIAIDVREVLPLISVPTLVVHRTDDRMINVGHGRYLGSRIPGARYVELSGEDHVPWGGDFEAICRAFQTFLTESRQAEGTGGVLATVLCAEASDEAGHSGTPRRALLDSVPQFVRHKLERFRGRLTRTTDTGFVATFDGPGRAVRCALALSIGDGGAFASMRVGLHTGEVEFRGTEITGPALRVAQQVMARSLPGEVLVSRVVTDLVAGDDLQFAARGSCALEGLTGQWELFAATA